MPDRMKINKGVLVEPFAQSRLTDSDLDKIIRLIYQRAGIVITRQRSDMIYNRLMPRLRALGIADFSDYLKRLESKPDSEEWQQFINALTTNLTSFFREAYHFPILAEHARSRTGRYNVWCTAASTGEEPYSIAITLDEVLGSSISGPRILASDIDTNVLARAREGTYRLSDIHTLSQERKKKYFLRKVTHDEPLVRVRADLQKEISFQQVNLIAEKWDVPAPFDAIFCRNVMIYFDEENQKRLLNRFANYLKPGGLLFVGHSEHIHNMDSPFCLQGQSVYYLAKDRVCAK